MGKWNIGNLIDPTGYLVGGGFSGSDGVFGGLGDSNAFEGKEIPLKQTPDYPEAEGARKLWWETLQESGPSNNYGAISPDWADIWNKTQQRINQSYWGSPTSSGAIGKVKASAARRGVYDSPALQTQIGRLGVQEQQDLQQLQTEQNKQQTQFGETARQNWMQSLAGLTGQQANYYYPQKEESMFDKLIKLVGAGAQVAGAMA